MSVELLKDSHRKKFYLEVIFKTPVTSEDLDLSFTYSNKCIIIL